MTFTIPTLAVLKEKLSLPKPWDTFVIFVLNILIAIPVFLIAHQNLIDLYLIFNLDRIFLFIVIVIIIQLVLRLVKTILILILFIYLISLFIGTIFGNYGFNRVFEDYRYMIYFMIENPNPQDIIISKLLPFPNKSKIIEAVEYTNPKVRNFALFATSNHFKNVKKQGEIRTMIQCFAVFKEIRNIVY